MRREIGLDGPLHLVEIVGRRLREADEKQPAEIAQMHRLEAEPIALGIGGHVLGVVELRRSRS